MKIIILFIGIFFFINARAQSLLIDSVITKASLQYTISALANDSMKGRLTGTSQLKDAANFISNHFKNAGLKYLAGNDMYFSYYPFVLNKTTFEAINVIGALPGNTNNDTIVIISAHYDHIGYRQYEGRKFTDTVFNGANDNASGVALLIELVKYYSTIKTNKYTILFIAFSGEELGLLGSADIASTIKPSLINAVINFEMMGRTLNNWTKKCMVIAKNPKSIIMKLNAALYPEKKFFINDSFPEENLFTRSDHYSFRKVIHSFSLMTTSPKDKYYHSLNDEIANIDFDFLLSTTKKVAVACEVFIK